MTLLRDLQESAGSASLARLSLRKFRFESGTGKFGNQAGAGCQDHDLAIR